MFHIRASTLVEIKLTRSIKFLFENGRRLCWRLECAHTIRKSMICYVKEKLAEKVTTTTVHRPLGTFTYTCLSFSRYKIDFIQFTTKITAVRALQQLLEPTNDMKWSPIHICFSILAYYYYLLEMKTYICLCCVY